MEELNNNNNNLNQQPVVKKKKNPITWFKGLKKPTKIILCSVLGVGVASAITFPILANTVWKKESVIEIKFTPSEDEYRCVDVELVEGKKYSFTLDMSGLDSECQPYFYTTDDKSSNEERTSTGKYISNLTAKTNTKTFTIVDGNPESYQIKYVNSQEENTYYLFGANSFVSGETSLTCTFIAKTSGKTNLVLYKD